MLIVKIGQLSTVYNYWMTRDDEKKWRHFQKAAFAFSGWIGLLKTWQGETIGTRRKINAIWWNVKINLQKLVDVCEYELPFFSRKKI